MKERISILNGILDLSPRELDENDHSALRVLAIYNTIVTRFEKDSYYGKKFVENNQQLMGLLTQAAVMDIANQNKKGNDYFKANCSQWYFNWRKYQ